MPAEGTDCQLWRHDVSLRQLRHRLTVRPEDIRVVSFDCFDTLIGRLCAEPADLFLEVGRRLAAANLLRLPLAPEEFQAARVAADAQARRRARTRARSPEITLAAIYDELPAVVSDIRSAGQVELETERHFCFLNPSIASLIEHVRSLGLPIALISDTYFTRAELCQLLAGNGFAPSRFDQILVSSEAGCAKWDGGLFFKACQNFDIHPHELLHIGDNTHADVEVARQIGVQPVLYHRATAREADTFTRERLLTSPAPRHAASVNALRVLTARLAHGEEDTFRDGAFVLGPVLALFADWCVRRFQAAGVRTVLALMREGEVLGALVERAAQAANVALKIEPCFVSRLSTARASVAEVTADTLADLLEGSPTVTLHNVLEILGVLDEVEKAIPSDILRRPVPSAVALRPLLARVLGQKPLAELIARRCQQSHALAFDYLHGLTRGETTLGFLDLGWSGSIQRNVLRILRQGGREVRGVGCYLATTPRSGRSALDGDRIHAFLHNDWQRGTILAEVAINACIGSTNGYARSPEGQVIPVLGSYRISPEERVLKQRIRDGIFAFQELWLAVIGAKGDAGLTAEMREDLESQSAAQLLRLIEHPSTNEARRLGRLTHDENYWDRTYSRPLCSEEATRQIARDGVASLFSDLHCYWPQGAVALQCPRLVSTLSLQWTEPFNLGRFGATATSAGEVSGLTEEERASLVQLLRHFQPEQVVIAGPAPTILEADLATLWPAPGQGQTKVRLVSFSPARAQPPWHLGVAGSAVDLPTTRLVLDALPSQGRVALVLTSAFAVDTAARLLNGLAPFLGRPGWVLANCGRADTVALAEEDPMIATVDDWFKVRGRLLGFAEWPAEKALEPAARNWRVLTRREPASEGPDYWGVTLTDLPLGARFGGGAWHPASMPRGPHAAEPASIV